MPVMIRGVERSKVRQAGGQAGKHAGCERTDLLWKILQQTSSSPEHSMFPHATERPERNHTHTNTHTSSLDSTTVMLVEKKYLIHKVRIWCFENTVLGNR